MKEQEIRAEVKAAVGGLSGFADIETASGIVLHPFNIMGGDRIIVTNQMNADKLIAYKHKKESGRLMLFEIPPAAFEAMQKIGDKEVVWCKSAGQRVMNINCALRQCGENGCSDSCEYLVTKKVISVLKKAVKKTALPPDIVIQQDYKGRPEEVDKNVYSHMIECECGNVRWIKKADVFQVTSCKPCAQKRKKDRIKAWKKSKKASKF